MSNADDVARLEEALADAEDEVLRLEARILIAAKAGAVVIF